MNAPQLDLKAPVVEAAGGILWRTGPTGREIAIIYRAHYNDWTLPKGKREPCETWQETALREVFEETGCQAFALPVGTTVVQSGQVSEVEAEICRTGIESDTTIELTVAPIMRRDSRGSRYSGAASLPAGCYRLTLLMLEPQAEAAGQCILEVKVVASGGEGVCQFEPLKAKYLRLACR